MSRLTSDEERWLLFAIKGEEAEGRPYLLAPKTIRDTNILQGLVSKGMVKRSATAEEIHDEHRGEICHAYVYRLTAAGVVAARGLIGPTVLELLLHAAQVSDDLELRHIRSAFILARMDLKPSRRVYVEARLRVLQGELDFDADKLMVKCPTNADFFDRAIVLEARLMDKRGK